MSIRFRITVLLAGLGFIGLITIYVLEFQWIHNTFEVDRLVWASISAGLLAGGLSAWKLHKKVKDEIAKIQLWVVCLLLPGLFGPLAGSLVNRLLSPHPVQMETFTFFEEKPFAMNRFGLFQGENLQADGYYIFFSDGGKLERIRSDRPRFKGVERGSRIELPVQKGLFGFRFVKFPD